VRSTGEDKHVLKVVPTNRMKRWKYLCEKSSSNNATIKMKKMQKLPILKVNDK
jgi:hypothetical protein